MRLLEGDPRQLFPDDEPFQEPPKPSTRNGTSLTPSNQT